MKLDRVHCGDCQELLTRIPDGSIDLAFADPPFNTGYDYDVYDDKKARNEYLNWCYDWSWSVGRALKPSGTFWLAIGDEYAAELKIMVCQELGLRCRSWVIWYYTFGVNCTRKFTRSHAHLFHFVKDAKHFTFNADAVKVPSARQTLYKDKRAKAGGRLPDDTWIVRPAQVPEAFTPLEDTWTFPRVCGTFKERQGWHGCQMPELLLERIVRVSSNPGEVVLDPFAGSGTTLAVARRLGRHWLGFEISPEYAAGANRRIEGSCPA